MSLQDPSVARALEGYGLKEPRVVGLLEASSRNENFLVETASGTRYVLRRYRRNQDERRVAFQLRFQRHVHEQGFPTALVVDTTAGRPYLVLDGIPRALFEFIEGEEYDFSRDEQAAEAGRRLAELHSLAASFQEDEIVVDWYRPLRDFWKTIHAETTELHDVFSGKGLEEELSFRAAWSQALTREWPIERVDALPQGWVHGDYHGRNVLFAEDRLVGLFDFDVIFRGPLAFDVAWALFMFGRDRRGSYRIRTDIAKRLVDAYGGGRLLLPEEMEAVPVFLLANHAYDSAYCLSGGNVSASPRSPRTSPPPMRENR